MILAKPKKPEKRITARISVEYPFDWTDKKVAMPTFLAWVKENTPARAENVTLELKEEWDYYGNDCTISLELSWVEVVDNPDYEREMKKYDTKLKKWKEQCKK